MEMIKKVDNIDSVLSREDHAELIDGAIVVTDVTSVAHNNAVLEIATALRQHIASHNGKCRVFTENVALFCNELRKDDKDNNLFMPDIMTICKEDGIKDDGVHTAPLFVAEITSDSTKKNDYGRKMVVYGDIGVQEYWVVDLQRKVVVRYLSENWFAPEVFVYDSTISMPILCYPGVEIDLTKIFI